MIKIFCDICEREIDTNSIWTINLHGDDNNNSAEIEYDLNEICIKCADKIHNIIIGYNVK